MNLELIKGSQLKILLKRKGIKSMDIVEAFDLNRIMVSRYFNDKAAMPADFIIKVAIYSKLSITDFIETKGDFYDVIDLSEHHEQISAAEPEIKYIPEPAKKIEIPPLKLPEHPKPFINIDTTELEDKITDLYHKIEDIQQQIGDIKKELELVNH
jgi:transcriptional regulator with XRE-family HTH domain